MAMADDFYVVCPDMVGRGYSDWLPASLPYTYPQYLSDLAALMARLTTSDKTPITWVGSSMGGLLGMILASMANSQIVKLVINDIGPFVSYTSLRKLRKAIGMMPTFKDRDEAMAYLKVTYAGFGDLTEEMWEFTADFMLRTNEDGRIRLHYDGRIADFPVGEEKPEAATDHTSSESTSSQNSETNASKESDAADAPPQGANFWPYWFAITCPVFVLRGAESALLPPELLAGMHQTKPTMQSHIVPGAAHAPALLDDETIQVVRQWLLMK
jgi:pimeloyl-ACP methyl ester carboxylesterase